MRHWYEESFGHEYLDLYQHRDLKEARADVRAIINLLAPCRCRPLLDLGCGAGRHLLALREAGFDHLVGLDLSYDLLAIAASSLRAAGMQVVLALNGTAPTIQPDEHRVVLIRSDMRHIPYRDCFSTVLSMFTSFGYFREDQENHKVLTSVYEALQPNGLFLMDYLNHDYVMSHLIARDEKQLPGRRVINTRRLTHDSLRVEKVTTIKTDGGDTRTYFESVRMYSERELRAMLLEAGFANVRSYGSLTADPFGPTSERLVITAQKRSNS